MKAFVRIFILSMVAIFLSSGLYFGLEKGWGRLRDIKVQFQDDLGQQQIFTSNKNRIEKSFGSMVGQWIWQVSQSDVMAKMKEDPFLELIKIKRVFPYQLIITLAFKKIELAWIDDFGKYYPIGQDASLLPEWTNGEFFDLPLLRGKNFFQNEKLRQRALELLNELPDTGRLSKNSIAELQYKPTTGFSLLLTGGGTEVLMGEDEYSLKASRVERVLSYLTHQQLRGRVIDARFAKKVVVRLRNDP